MALGVNGPLKSTLATVSMAKRRTLRVEMSLIYLNSTSSISVVINRTDTKRGGSKERTHTVPDRPLQPFNSDNGDGTIVVQVADVDDIYTEICATLGKNWNFLFGAKWKGILL